MFTELTGVPADRHSSPCSHRPQRSPSTAARHVRKRFPFDNCPALPNSRLLAHYAHAIACASGVFFKHWVYDLRLAVPWDHAKSRSRQIERGTVKSESLKSINWSTEVRFPRDKSKMMTRLVYFGNKRWTLISEHTALVFNHNKNGLTHLFAWTNLEATYKIKPLLIKKKKEAAFAI